MTDPNFRNVLCLKEITRSNNIIDEKLQMIFKVYQSINSGANSYNIMGKIQRRVYYTKLFGIKSFTFVLSSEIEESSVRSSYTKICC